ncbi:MAG: hypothetical protein NVSMB23_19650 [Myxococcales bacterium]
MDPTASAGNPARTVDAALRDLLARSKVLKLATAGGPVSPWITSTYFVEDGPARIHLILERTGKGMANVRANPRVALAVDDATPFTIFAQAEGSVRVLEGDAAALRLAALRAKVPEIEPLLMGPHFVVEIAVSRWLVTSFPDGWFPAKELRPSA